MTIPAWQQPLSDEQVARMTPRQGALIRVVERYERQVRALNPHAEHDLVLPLAGGIVQWIEEALDSLDYKCESIIRHGPGHQSKSRCELTGPHDVHQTLVTGEILRWRGDEAFTGFFDESPEE